MAQETAPTPATWRGMGGAPLQPPSADAAETSAHWECSLEVMAPRSCLTDGGTTAPPRRGRSFPIPTSKQVSRGFTKAVEVLSPFPGGDTEASPKLCPLPGHPPMAMFHVITQLPSSQTDPKPASRHWAVPEGTAERWDRAHSSDASSPAACSWGQEDRDRASSIFISSEHINSLQKRFFRLLSTPRGSPLIPSAS